MDSFVHSIKHAHNYRVSKGPRRKGHRGRQGYRKRLMGLAKKLIVCRQCGTKNPDYVLQCSSCTSALHGARAKDPFAAREGRTSYGLTDFADGHRTDDRKPIWQTKYRNRVALNLFLMALFAFILITDLLSGASAFYIAVVLTFLVLSTTRFLLTLRRIRREYPRSSSIEAE
jgi:ribosomal protein L40E